MLTAEHWRSVFEQTPEALGDLLRDLFAAARRDGDSMADVLELVEPKVATTPFWTAVGDLEVDVDALAGPQDRSRPPSRALIESVAEAAGVSPAYFVEYRRGVVLGAVARLLDADPRASVVAYRVVKRHLTP